MGTGGAEAMESGGRAHRRRGSGGGARRKLRHANGRRKQQSAVDFRPLVQLRFRDLFRVVGVRQRRRAGGPFLHLHLRSHHAGFLRPHGRTRTPHALSLRRRLVVSPPLAVVTVGRSTAGWGQRDVGADPHAATRHFGGRWGEGIRGLDRRWQECGSRIVLRFRSLAV